MQVVRISLDEVESTSDYVRGIAAQHEGSVVVVSALHQTAGRGQGGNRWESSRGDNVLTSVLFRPIDVPPSRQFALSMAGALAVREAIIRSLPPTTGMRQSDVDALCVKWPNDVFYRNRKISGTLIETTLRSGRLADCVFGVGINVNQVRFSPDAGRPTSLRIITGGRHNVGAVLDRLTAALLRRIDQVNNGDYEGIRAEYLAALYRRNGLHPYYDASGMFLARTFDVEPDGHLVLQDENGNVRRYGFKEVEFLFRDEDETAPTKEEHE